MNLYEARKGMLLRISAIKAPGELKQRLISFGVIRGAELEVLEFSLTKRTVEIKVDNTRIALRKEEAEYIEVES